MKTIERNAPNNTGFYNYGHDLVLLISTSAIVKYRSNFRHRINVLH